MISLTDAPPAFATWRRHEQPVETSRTTSMRANSDRIKNATEFQRVNSNWERIDKGVQTVANRHRQLVGEEPEICTKRFPLYFRTRYNIRTDLNAVSNHKSSRSLGSKQSYIAYVNNTLVK